MITIELTEGNLVAPTFQGLSDPSPTTVDRKNVIMCSMRDEEARFCTGEEICLSCSCLRYKTWREGRDTSEQVGIEQTESNRIRRTIGKPTDGNACRIYSGAFKYTFKRTVQEIDIWSEASTDCIPRCIARVRSEHGNSRFFVC